MEDQHAVDLASQTVESLHLDEDDEFVTPSPSPCTREPENTPTSTLFNPIVTSPASSLALVSPRTNNVVESVDPCGATSKPSSPPPSESPAIDLSTGKHFFVLSHAGKPIYSRLGDEQQLGPVMGMVQAVVSLSQSLGNPRRNGDKGGKETIKSSSRYSNGNEENCCLRSIRTVGGCRQFVFLLRQELIFMVVSNTREPEPFLRLQLEYLYHQIVFLLTSPRITHCFAVNPAYDLRELLGGTHRILSGIADMASPTRDSLGSLMTSAAQALPLDPTLRHDLAQALVNICASTPGLQPVLYALLLSGNRLVTLVEPRDPPWHRLRASDLLLLSNFLTTQPFFRTENETWTPICLPRFNDTGFLYAFVACMDPRHSLYLLLVSPTQEPEQFRASSKVRKAAQALFEERGWLAALKKAAAGEHRQRALNKYSNAGMAFHFMYKFCPVTGREGGRGGNGRGSGGKGDGRDTSDRARALPQSISSNFFFPYVDEEAKQAVWNLYAKALLQLRYGGREGGTGWAHAGDRMDCIFKDAGGEGGKGVGVGNRERHSTSLSASSGPSSRGVDRVPDDVDRGGRRRRSDDSGESGKGCVNCMMEVFEKKNVHSLVYELRETDCLVVSVGPDFELFALLSAAPTLRESLQSLNRMLRAIKRDERWLFMVEAAHW